MTDNETVNEILSIVAGNSNAPWLLADALRRAVNPDLGAAALAIAGIAMDRSTDPDATQDEIAAAHWAASAALSSAAEDVLCEYQFDTMPHVVRPHPDFAHTPVFRSVRAVRFQEAAE